MQLLFISFWDRCDVQTAVGFLTIFVYGPDKDDCGELNQVWKYLNQTKHLNFIISPYTSIVSKWYIDASFAVTNNCKDHIENMLAMGKKVIKSFLNKIRLNRNGSTESELSSVDVSMPHMLWHRYLMETQVYNVIQISYIKTTRAPLLLSAKVRLSVQKRQRITRHFY